MISKKIFNADGTTNRFLSDFIIRSEQFVRVYAYIYDNTLPIDGSGDVLQDPNSAWSFPGNLYKRGANFPNSGQDLLNLDKWDLADNSILLYSSPTSGTKLYIEVATTAEEFGDTLTAPSVERAEAAQAAAEAAQVAAEAAQAAAETAETNASTSETNASASETAAALSASNASTSETNAGTSETNAASSATAAATSATNAATSETNAAASATTATNAANSAIATAGATQWVSGTSYTAGDAVWSPINFQTYRAKTTHSNTVDPSLDTTNWERLGGGAQTIQPTLTGNATVVEGADLVVTISNYADFSSEAIWTAPITSNGSAVRSGNTITVTTVDVGSDTAATVTITAQEPSHETSPIGSHAFTVQDNPVVADTAVSDDLTTDVINDGF